jgi:hypothetical protein
LPLSREIARRVARVDCLARLEEKYRSFGCCARPVINTLGYDVGVASLQINIAIIHANRDGASQNQEELVGVWMAVPRELSVQLSPRKWCTTASAISVS